MKADFDDSLLALLSARGAGRLAHPGGTLLAHLRRTAERLETWGADRALVTAGLCHAAYGTQGFPAALFDVCKREELRTHIGDESEAIVYAYGALDRGHARRGEVELRDRFSGEYWVAPALLQHRLAELTVANELDVVEHGELAPEELANVFELMSGVAPWLSQAGWAALSAAACAMQRAAPELAPRGDRDLAFRDLGTQGERVVLWHGGAGPELTWSRQHALSSDLRLRIPWRRGFAPSVASPRQDWELDVRDLLRIMSEPTHVVAHSYGGVSAVLAAARAPERFASLVVIEAPLRAIALDDPELRQFAELSRAFASGVPEARAAFLALAGLPLGHEQTARTERLARGFRDPLEAEPDFARLRRAGVHTAIVSGGHNRAIERLCDAVARELAAERWRLPGAGHAVQRVPEFNARLRAFIGALPLAGRPAHPPKSGA
jgi:pimeloyl-ACP methyl ester carboxylesterase